MVMSPLLPRSARHPGRHVLANQSLCSFDLKIARFKGWRLHGLAEPFRISLG